MCGSGAPRSLGLQSLPLLGLREMHMRTSRVRVLVRTVVDEPLRLLGA